MNRTDHSSEQQTLALQQELDLAMQHHTAGHLPEAENIYQQILQTDPDHPDALHLLGVVSHQKGENDCAVDLMKKALVVKPDFAVAHCNLGNVLRELGRLEEAIASCQMALDIEPNFTRAHSNLGNLLREAGRLDEAITSCKRALAINPDYAEAHSNFGLALQDLKRLDEAIGSYQKALDIKPDFAEAHINLGNAHQELVKLNESVASYQKALTIKPDYAEAHCNLGSALQKMGLLDEAVASNHKALAIKPDYAEAHSNLGNLLWEIGRLDDAVASYHKAIDIKPDFPEAFCNLGNLLRNLGKLDEALENYHKVIAIRPDYPVHSDLGTTLQELGRFENAIHSYDLAQTNYSRAKILECLYALEMYEELYLSLDDLLAVDKNNIRAAAISAFTSQQLSRADPHPFCKQPMNFVRVYKGLDSADDGDGLLHRLITELKSRANIWEPTGKTTKMGFQSPGDLFFNPKGALADLEQIIRDKLEHYRFEFASEDCDFIRLMPRKMTLKGWVVRLLKGGHQTEHIHPDGWLSGVFYLQVPKFSDQEEGSIEFGLWGNNYPIINKSYPRRRYYPNSGDIVLFPSSLFHRTIPFHLNEERISIAFDLTPT